MFVITEDHGTDDYMEILAVTDDEGVAQEMVLILFPLILKQLLKIIQNVD